jgi:hypothetical protein
MMRAVQRIAEKITRKKSIRTTTTTTKDKKI